MQILILKNRTIKREKLNKISLRMINRIANYQNKDSFEKKYLIVKNCKKKLLKIENIQCFSILFKKKMILLRMFLISSLTIF